MTPTIASFYRYALLATASYVRMGNQPIVLQRDGATFAQQAANQSLGRPPLTIARYLFDPTPEFPNSNSWAISYYHADDKPGVDEKSGFAATLFKNSEENVLAIRGAEAGLTDGDIYRDLIGASIGGEQVSHIRGVFSTTRPLDRTVVEPGYLRIGLAPRRRPQ